MFSTLGYSSGYRIMESTHMTISKTKVYKVGRKWKKRRVKRVTETYPNPEVMVVGDMVVGHPATIKKMLSAVEAQSRQMQARSAVDYRQTWSDLL
jgi:hypothetical protein